MLECLPQKLVLSTFFFTYWNCFLNTKHEYTEKKFKKYKYKGMHFFLV